MTANGGRSEIDSIIYVCGLCRLQGEVQPVGVGEQLPIEVDNGDKAAVNEIVLLAVKK
jgi:hypothetical protein